MILRQYSGSVGSPQIVGHGLTATIVLGRLSIFQNAYTALDVLDRIGTI